MKRVGVDVGGTFTDLVLWDDGNGDRFVDKVPSTADPADAVIGGLDELCALAGISPDQVDLLLHGTTVATNIVIERTGARTAMITTEGFRDILHIARKKRPLTFSSYQDVPWQASPLVTRADRLTVPERTATRDGSIAVPLDEDALLRALAVLAGRGVQSVAICFLGSFANPHHEQRAAEPAAARPVLPCRHLCASSAVVPLYREYERFKHLRGQRLRRPEDGELPRVADHRPGGPGPARWAPADDLIRRRGGQRHRAAPAGPAADVRACCWAPGGPERGQLGWARPGHHARRRRHVHRRRRGAAGCCG